MKKVDYNITVMYPFTIEIKESDDHFIGQCAEIPGIILQADSIVELKARFIQVTDGWFYVQKKIDDKNRRKMKLEYKKKFNK